MAKYVKKPIVVDAEQFFYDWVAVPGVYHDPVDNGQPYVGDAYVITIHGQKAYLENGDFVITEPDGVHHYPCKKDIFYATYDPIAE